MQQHNIFAAQKIIELTDREVPRWKYKNYSKRFGEHFSFRWEEKQWYISLPKMQSQQL